MKRTSLILLLLACFNVQNLFCADAPREMSKTGAITVINLEKTTFTIERTTDKAPFTFIAAKDILAKFKVGQVVDVTYTKDEKGNRIVSKVVVSEKPAVAHPPAHVPDKVPAVEAPKKESVEKDDLDIGAPKDPTEKK